MRSLKTDSKLEIYLAYDELDLRAFGELLGAVGEIVQKAGDCLSLDGPEWYVKSRILTSEQAHQLASKPTMSANLSAARTGQSVRFTTEYGFDVRLEDGELTVSVPRSVAITGFVLWVLYSAALRGLGAYDQTLDIRLKQLELDLKKHELERVSQSVDLDEFVPLVVNAVDAAEATGIKTFGVNGVDLLKRSGSETRTPTGDNGE